MRNLFRRAIAPFLLVSMAACGPSTVAVPAPVAVEDTVAFELLRLESRARNLPPEAEPRLRAVLGDALAALGPDPRPPESADEFRAFAKKVSIALAAHNHIQPVDPADWVNSVGQALQAVPADHPSLSRYLGHRSNRERKKHVKPDEPFHFLDCDMASLLLISVAQMVGFDLQLVEVPRHNFVRWSNGRGEQANWDWTYWGSHPDSYYARNRAMTEVQRNRGRWLRSQPVAESRGYLIGALAAIIPDPAQRLELVREAVKGAPNNPITAEVAAWAFATIKEGVTDKERQSAVPYALTALAGDPGNAGYSLTAACAFSVAGSADVAAALQQRAASLASPGDSKNFRVNLERMRRGELCGTVPEEAHADDEEE